MVWCPQPGPQKALIDCPLPEVFYGGARGGGKTDGILGKYGIKALTYGEAFNAVFFRREMPQQDDLIERARQIYGPIDAEWYEQKKMFRFPGGGRVRFRPLENVQDAEKYQGQNLTDAAVEEAGNYPSPQPIDRLFGCLRSTAGVPIQLLLTANPGGPGHHWINERYIAPAPLGMKVLRRTLPNGAVHRYVYIPSKVQNNRALLTSDPEYINRLYLVGSPELVRAWLEGDWSVIAGAYFPEFSMTKHVIEPFEIPHEWARFRSGDWGSAKPFAIHWWAVVGDDYRHKGQLLPRGALICYREWYGKASANVGLRLTAEEVGRGIAERESRFESETLRGGVLDPAAFAQDGGPSIAERIFEGSGKRIMFNRADNARVGRNGAMGGWDQFRSRLKGDGDRPMIYFFSTAVDMIRTLPALQHDQTHPEDVDTEGEDHAPDSGRYACMSRPYVPTKIIPIKGKTLQEMSLNDLWDAQPTQSHSRI